MASRYIDKIDAVQAQNRALWGVVGLLGGLCLYALYGLKTVPSHLTIDIPPDLRNGAHVRSGEMNLANVYAFAAVMWQQVNHWPNDGGKDYGGQLYRMAAYLTPSCLHRLQEDLDIKFSQGELAQRVRMLSEIVGQGYDEAKVTPLDAGIWRVQLDTQLAETLKGVPVKDVYIRYPLRIVRFDADREVNPWGLAIDCWPDDDPPVRIDPLAKRSTAEAN